MTASVPTTMRAAAIDKFGGPEVIHVEALPVPTPKAGEVLIQLDAAGIGVWDPYVREGQIVAGRAEFPRVIGNDGAGVVVAVGEDVSRFREGDRVYAFAFEGGFYAEYVAVKKDNAAAMPSNLTPEEAGALGADGITALQGLDDQLHIQQGERLMIFGASGGVGHIAVQLAKRMGAQVLAIASGSDGVELARRLGADAVVEGHGPDLEENIRLFAPDGLDAALVLAGGRATDAALTAMKANGRVAYPNGVTPLPRAPKGISTIAYDALPTRGAFDRLNRLIEQGPFHVELGRTYSLEDAALAHRQVQDHFLGKLAFRIRA